MELWEAIKGAAAGVCAANATSIYPISAPECPSLLNLVVAWTRPRSDSCHPLTSPPLSHIVTMNANTTISRLPFEILHEIFLMCILSSMESNQFYIQIVLSHVCLQWRDMILDSPLLYPHIFTLAPNSDKCHQLTRAFFQRSQNLNVGVTLDVTDTPIHSDREFALLVKNAHRIDSLELRCDDMDQVPALLACLPVALPEVKLFRVIARHGHRELLHRDLQFTFCLQPGAGCAPICVPFVHGVIQWRNWDTSGITHLYLNGLSPAARPSMEDLWHILNGCRNTLQVLEYKGWTPFWHGPESVLRRIKFPRLRQVELLWMNNICPVAGLIFAPNLQVLKLQNGLKIGNPYPWEGPYEEHDPRFPKTNIVHLLECLEPSCGALQHLSLYGIKDCPRSAVDSFFASLPALDALIFFHVCPSIEDALFQPECRYHPSTQVIFPQLRSLSIPKADVSDLGRLLLRHKRLPVAPIRTLYVMEDMETALKEKTIHTIIEACKEESGLTMTVVGQH
ncbi:hypothetical protein R3P38DRAFT_2935367 [Favolaschia claudopus]|uniref:F-box domain-containing protein n=1 Tax=Favolaschia claudopus TaxID=2862362 RepID=A0AAW0BPU2_9AGAR